MRGGFSGDWHYGLSVEDLDRTPDVHEAVMFIVDECIRMEVDFLSIGGDLTDNNTPLPDHLALLIQVLHKLDEAGIITFVTRGNHEAISAPGRLWGLTPLEKVGYENVHFITEPKLIDFEGTQLLFLPHVTKAQASEKGFKTPQEFINAEAEKLVDECSYATVISHYNVNGATAGTEAMMLRQTDLQLPPIVMRSPKIAKIVNSHIHTAQDTGKIIMPGSPVCTDFGDLKSPKGFLVGDFNGDEWQFDQILTPASPMQEIELNLVGVEPAEIREYVKAIKTQIQKDAIVKVRITVEEEKVAFIDFDKLKIELSKKARFVKQIDRVITRKRQVRDPNQKLGMTPVESVTQYLEFRNPEGMDRKLALAMSAIKGETLSIKDSGASFGSPTAASDALDEALDKFDNDEEDEIRPFPDLDDEEPDFDDEDDLGVYFEEASHGPELEL